MREEFFFCTFEAGMSVKTNKDENNGWSEFSSGGFWVQRSIFPTWCPPCDGPEKAIHS